MSDRPEKKKPAPYILPNKNTEMRYHVPARDTQGHSVRVQFHMPPVLLAQIQKIVASKMTPIRKNGDLYRVAVWHMVKEIERLEGPIPSVIIKVDAILDIMRDDELASDFQAIFAKLGTRIADHMGRGAIGEATRLSLAVKKQIMGMPEGYWHDRYMTEFTDRFGHLIDSKRKASLIQFEKDKA